MRAENPEQINSSEDPAAPTKTHMIDMYVRRTEHITGLWEKEKREWDGRLAVGGGEAAMVKAAGERARIEACEALERVENSTDELKEWLFWNPLVSRSGQGESKRRNQKDERKKPPIALAMGKRARL